MLKFCNHIPLVISRQHSGMIVKKEITRNKISFELKELILSIGFIFISVNIKKKIEKNPPPPIKSNNKNRDYEQKI